MPTSERAAKNIGMPPSRSLPTPGGGRKLPSISCRSNGTRDPTAIANTDELFQADFETMKKAGTIVLEEGGSYAAAKSKAANVVEATYRVPFLAHARMEPGNATAMVTPGRVDVWSGDQSPQFALLRAADEAGVTPDQVFIHTTFLGGGYGGGGGVRPGAPGRGRGQDLERKAVKLLWTREEDMRVGEKYADGYRPVRGGARRRRMGLWQFSMRTNGDRYDRSLTPAGTYKNMVFRTGRAAACTNCRYFVPTRY